MKVRIVEGDLLDQPTEAIVNAWNRNILPWWLLIPQGVSGPTAAQGHHPRRRHQPAWRASKFSIEASVRNAMAEAVRLGVSSVAFPVIGAGSGGFNQAEAERIMLDAFAMLDSPVQAVVVRFRAKASSDSRPA